ncbi:hypothetical protein [Sediminispirochaeta smaragdinae]|uniref:Alginate export domain-containing protein n=1 Tax=Sediminispirochaeta smaragdinae (strain DSM 11293 / JCM 15392 / SEBR 4228) TaxID=573413 RepID=E1R7V5_SEDSS|nr:hypothetical protein [Sediminispirochaeta smaragdinae]ADK82810.1 hypothetical protein Spirs_3724 [Sediminispirochaeta smaragdinae DSM 11293]
MSSLKRTATVAFTAAALLLAGVSLPADDFSFDDFGSSDFGDDTGTATAGNSSALEVHGELDGSLRATVGEDALSDIGAISSEDDSIEYGSEAKLNLTYTGDKIDAFINLQLDPDRLDEDMSTLFDEAYLRYYGSGFDFETGLMKVVWGKGDQLHVVDLLNSDDLTDFINPDYIDRRIAVPMAKLNVQVGGQGKLEFVYIPTLTPNTNPTSGAWATQQAQDLAAAVTSYLDTLAGSDAVFTTLNSYEDMLYPDTDTLDYSQAAVRWTDSFGGMDVGALYYCGFLKDPSVDVANLDISYDRLHAFGLEAGGILAGFNLRSEAAYYMTEDIAGDDPVVHNNSLNYLVGFDRDLPLHNINLNMQATGSYILNNDEISSGDIEYDSDDDYSSNLIVCKISDTFNHEKVSIEAKGIYEIEDEDWMIGPVITLAPNGEFEFSAEARFFGGDDDGRLGQFDESSYLQLKVKAMF